MKRLLAATLDVDLVWVAVDEIRSRWKKRDFVDLAVVAREAFAPYEVTYFHYASSFEIGDHLETADNEEFKQFKGFGRLGGKKDILTSEVAKALSDGEGVAWLDNERDPANNLILLKRGLRSPRGECLIFTLPEEGTWTSYILVKYSEPKKSEPK